MTERIHVSIVSHGQSQLVSKLLADLAPLAAHDGLRITVLSNIAEAPPVVPASLQASIDLVVNEEPAGYGTNHNRVFARSRAPFFCVLNPDLRIPHDPFPSLLDVLDQVKVGVVAPAAVDPSGAIQDNARVLPTPWRIAKRAWGNRGGPDYSHESGPLSVDWVAGFFMLVRSEAYRALNGFDERYFLYYEDIDLCTRARLMGWQVRWVPQIRVVHDARRRSHRHPRYLIWHMRSITRFFGSKPFRDARRLRAS